jgi:peptidoglycan/LPS O-acetylase OafA/YrhL
LRGVAALMVLFHHTLLMLPDFANYEWHVPGATSHGVAEWLLLRTPLRLLWAGQERALLFFVLSGFVLGLPWLEGRRMAYSRFLLNRFCRIYPPYIIAMVIATLGSLLLGGIKLDRATIYFDQLGWSFPLSWQALPSVLGILNNPHSRFLNEAVWSLVWEVRVALIFPLLILPMARWRNKGAAVVLMILILLRHVFGRFFGPGLSDTLNYPQDTFYYAEYFVFGAAVALNRVVIAAWFGNRGRWVGVVSLVAGCLICWVPWPRQHDIIVGIGAAVILATILGSGQIRSWLVGPPLIWLGRQSYSLYLTHLPLIMTVAILFGGKIPFVICVAILPAAVGLAELFRCWVEMPSVAFAQRITGYAGRIAPVPALSAGGSQMPV